MLEHAAEHNFWFGVEMDNVGQALATLGRSVWAKLRFLMRRALTAGLTVALLTAFVPPVLAGSDEERIKQLAIEAILENPEIVAQAMSILRERDADQQASALRTTLQRLRPELDEDDNAPILGNVEGDVTLIEFFDYNCPYCKSVAPDILSLIEEDRSIRLVYREWPILGEDSLFAARAALAAREQGLYEELHWALMSLRRATKQTVLIAAEEVGLNIEQLQRDMTSEKIAQHIERSMQLAREIGLSGTPSFVLGDRVIPGAISLEEMRDLLQQYRAEQP